MLFLRFLLIQTVILFTFTCTGQFAQNGIKGLIGVPTAELIEDRSIAFGIQTNPGAYKFIINANRLPPYNNEMLYACNIGFIPRTNLILNLVRDMDKADTIDQGIGDRSIKLAILLSKEKKFLPAVSINLNDPVFSSNSYQSTNNIVITKNFELTDNINAKLSSGYGTPYILAWYYKGNRRKFQKNPYYDKYSYLIGIFGGAEFTLSNKYQICLEYDGDKMNASCGVILYKRLFIEGNLIGLDHFGIGVNYLTKLK